MLSMYRVLALVACMCALLYPVAAVPSQIHIALGGNPHSMTVQWATKIDEKGVRAVVQYGSSSDALTETEPAEEFPFTGKTHVEVNLVVHARQGKEHWWEGHMTEHDIRIPVI